jgi:hypothetical protein
MAGDSAATLAALAAAGIGTLKLPYTQALEAQLSAGTNVVILAGIPGKTIIPWYFGNFYTTTVAGSGTSPSDWTLQYTNGTSLFILGGRTTTQAPGTYGMTTYSTNRAFNPHVGTGLGIQIRGQAGPGVGALMRTGTFYIDYFVVPG